ncbi:MAG: DUF507 family protein [Helicobacter sp.]|nr:DUF507 family protein [Helicobacter sp.]MDE5817484.1 DUF507 family protein [Helicobacter sp.]MDE6043938.1 DUF507 family protein [Helicobacter sp.]MDE7196466.1 DUF507 family protein [Helicobacter sp.]
MKLRLSHAPYIANKIALDLVHSGVVELDSQPLEKLAEVSRAVLENDIKSEQMLEEEVREILENRVDEIEFLRADERALFWLVKKELASKKGIPLGKDERYNNLSHAILDAIIQEDIVWFDVPENRIRNIIYKAINDYTRIYESIEDFVEEKIKSYKRRIVVGSEEYDIIFEKLYEEELRKRGFL